MAAETVGRHKARVRADAGKTNEEKVMGKEQFTKAPWNYYIKEATDADGSTKKKCYIEVQGTALAQFANFGDVMNEANCILAAAAPDMYEILDYLDYYFALTCLRPICLKDGIRRRAFRRTTDSSRPFTASAEVTAWANGSSSATGLRRCHIRS